MGWYSDWVNHMSLTQIAKKNGVTCGTVHTAIAKTGEWVRAKRFDKITHFIERQVAALEVIALEAWTAWQKSIRTNVVITDVASEHGSTTTKTEEEIGDPRYLAEYRAAMADIRKIEGLDRATKVEVSVENSDLPRVAGLDRSEAIRVAAAAMLATAEAIGGE